jgi:hypothetical protein
MNTLIIDLSPARAALDRADAAYTLAVQVAAGGGDWGHVSQAAEATHQARAALTHAEKEA